MQKLSIAALLGSLLAVPLSGAMSQSTDQASAYTLSRSPHGEYIVFFDSGSNRLSPLAIETVRSAAQAARSARTIELEGRADYTNAVKQELVRQGVSADAISVHSATNRPLQKVGASDPIDRRVEIRF
jgi:outer membrane protein OmpA-like peptidoglycan-associated protein